MTTSSDGINQFIGSPSYNDSTLDDAKAELGNFLNLAVGASNYALTTDTEGYLFDWRPNISQAFGLTITPTDNKMVKGVNRNNIRFSHCYAQTLETADNYFAAINSTDLANTTFNLLSGQSDDLAIPDYLTKKYCWLSGNATSIGSFFWDKRTGYSLFVWTGLTIDPREEEEANAIYPENACSIVLGSDGTNNIAAAIRAGFINTNTPQPILTSGEANYPIICKVDAADEEQSLVAYWSLEEASGDRLDATGKGLDLEDLSSSVSRTAGKIGQAALFTATSSSNRGLTAKDSESEAWKLFETDFTLSFWVESFGERSTEYLISKQRVTNDYSYHFILERSSQRLKISVRRGIQAGIESLYFPFTITPNVAQHLVITHDQSNKSISLFVNGEFKNSESYTYDIIYNSGQLVEIGGFGNSYTSSLKGWLDEMGLWNKILPNERITEIYNDGSGLGYNDLYPDTGNQTTDLYLLDDNTEANNPTTGRCPNLLLARSANFEIGKFYQIQQGHIDGGSSNFICVGDWGTDKILMRTAEVEE